MAQGSAAGWNVIPPGFSAEVLLNHNNVMWAAGSAETIAVSSDAGQHWIKKHENQGGALLLSLAFVGEKFGYAAGTDGAVVFTRDGGETWTARKLASETILQAAFGDENHGIIRTRSALTATTDGGKNWKQVVPSNDADWSSKYPFTDGMAALDQNHLIVRVSEGQFSDGEFLWTSDGGTNWTANYLPNGAGGAKPFVIEGQYWIVGSEVVGKDKPGGGYSTPMAVRSRDGALWEHLPVYHDVCHWHGCGGCTPQGCFAGQSSFVPFSRILQDSSGNTTSASGGNSATSASLYRFPSHLLSSQWALSGETICMATSGAIECSKLNRVSALDTQSESFDFQDVAWPPLHPTRAGALSVSIESVLGHGLRCIRCDLGRTYFSSTGNSGPTPFGLSFVVGKSGRAEKISVSGPVPADVSAKLRQSANLWLFEPFIVDGKPKEMPVSLSGKVFVMNFTKPPK